MKVYYSLEDFKALENAIVTTGTFDGVHVGHKKILDQLNSVAEENGGESVLLTFFPHPRMVLQPELELKLLNHQSEKIELLKKTGLDHLIIHPFTKEFSRTSSLDFVRNILISKIGAKKLVIGYDHHFGRNREGSFEHLMEFGPVYGFDVEEIPAQDIEDITISSTKIRNAISNGEVNVAANYLGYKYRLNGKVVEGEKIGKTLGYPTANILVDENYKLIPKDGVYAVKLNISSKPETSYSGMCNIGVRPTFGHNFKTIEVNLFNFNQDIYGERVRLTFHKRIRDEEKFENLDALKNQLKLDQNTAYEILDID